MDQDFHYYGTYFAARTVGIEPTVAARMARASNFIDFLHEGDYGGTWRLVADDGTTEVGVVDHPRYTFQAGKLSTGVAPEDGLWCSFHFTPGNYDDLDGPSTSEVHGAAVADQLPPFETRDVREQMGTHAAPLLNRPQSALSRTLLADTLLCTSGPNRAEAILRKAVGGEWLLDEHGAVAVERFQQLLTGVRAHVIADTWAHQDFSGIDHEINTYFDVANELGRQSIDYRDVGTEWHRTVLSCFKHENLQAVPNGTSYLGHGWMGHFPDYSFVRYRYKPRWRDRRSDPIERNNPEQYRHAFLELCSLFAQSTRAERFDPESHEAELATAARAIDQPFEIASSKICPRNASSRAWLAEFAVISGSPTPEHLVDAQLEPDNATRLAGLVGTPDFPMSMTRWGTFTVEAFSDLYLFQVAADYHFHFVKNWLSRNRLREFTGSWSQRLGPLDASVVDLFE